MFLQQKQAVPIHPKPDGVDEITPGSEVHLRVKKEHTGEFEFLLNSLRSDYEVANKNLQLDIDMEWLALHQNGRAHTLTNYNNLATIKSWLQDQASVWSKI